ncbi:hypothetical protein SHIRM173S_10195 [Streptomyces hirsutus]
MAGRYPQAADLAEFWDNLRAGRDCVTEVPAERWPHDRYFDPQPNTPGRTYGKWGGFLDGIDRFDRAFFGVSRREAERMDPQERLFLTTAWQAVEDAGHRPDRLDDRSMGVFVGVMSSHFQLVDDAPDEPLPLALHSSVANRVSYRMDLRGPSIAVDTACSSSLTAIHLAVQALRSGECTWALAGGVNVMPHPEKYLQLAAGQWLSRDGRCRSFGEGGTGYVPGEGVGALVLKPLAAALADGDHIHGVIRGSRLDHGGRASGFTVPNPGADGGGDRRPGGGRNGPRHRHLHRGARHRDLARRPDRGAGFARRVRRRGHHLRTRFGQVGHRSPGSRRGRRGDQAGPVVSEQPPAPAPRTSAPPLVLRGASVRNGQPRPSAPMPPPPPPAAPEPALEPPHRAEERHDEHAIAVIGMAGRFPGAPTLDGFWATSPPLRTRLPGRGRGPGGRRRGARSCGVFVGCTQSDYRQIRHAAGRHDTAHSFLGGAPSVLAARVSYFLNLTGPTAAVDSACSSSLLAVHLACQSILSGDCEMAVAGGVALMLGPDIHVQTSAAGILSPTGRSAPFDATADGIVLGEGVGAVVLKPLACALADGDHVHGVIRASGANGDGRSNGIAAPSGRAQADLLTRVWRRAGVTPDEIGLVEAHGTGTPLGDPIEVKALTEAFRRAGGASASCAIGSVKGNVGHTTMAAGIASLLKVLLALRHRQLPPTAGFTLPNPRLDLDDSPFHVVTEVRDWLPGPSGQRVAAVSSFGVSGTNCHLVVAEAPARPRHTDTRAFVVPVSARTPRELTEHLGALAEAVPAAPHLADVAYALCVGRRHHPERAVVVARTLDGLAAALRAAGDGTPPSLADATPEQRRLAEEYLAGGRPDFAAQFRQVDARRTPLPAHPLRGTRHWPRPTAAPGLTWWVDPDAWQVADHRVGGTPVLPGTGALALAAVAAGDEGPLELSGVRWLRPLQADTAQQVRVETDGSRFTLRRGDTDIATATVEPSTEPLARLPLDDITRRCPVTRAGEELYARFDAAGLHYGPAFRVVDEVRVGDGEALGRLTGTDRPSWSTLVDVAALDGAIQVASVLAGEGELLLPFAAARVVVRPADGPPAWAHVRRTPDGITVRLAGENGREHARIEGLVARPARDERQDVRPPVSVLVPHWTEADAEAPDPAPARPGRTLVLYARGAEGLARALADRCDGRSAPLAEGPDRLTRTDVDAVHLVLTGGAAEDPDTDPVVAQVFDCVRALAGGPAARRPLGLTAILDGALPAAGTAVTCPARAGVLGVLRAARAEHPRWGVRCLDAGGAGEAEAETLLRAPAGLPVLACRAGRWLTQVFRPLPDGTGEGAGSPWRARGVHLIVGGAGGIGYALSRHLARTTAADVVWLGRRPATDATVAERLAAVEAAGGRARYVQGDVSRPGDVRAALATAHAAFGPVTTVVHAALDLRDRTLAFAEADDLRAAMRAKDRGVRVLHEVLRDEPLDHFVLFSSAVSAIDSPGQAAYAAASTVEDALGRALHARGPVPVTVVNWGYWGSVGVVADPQRARAMAEAGVGSIEPTDGFAALERILTARAPQALVARATPEALRDLGVVVEDSVADNDPLDTLAGALLAGELTAVGALPAPGERRPVATTAQRLGVQPAHQRLFEALLPILERAGTIRRDGADLVGTGPVPVPAVAVPEAEGDLLRRCVSALPDVLAGRRNPLEVLFPGGSTERLARFYGGGPAERAVNRTLAAHVRRHVDARGPGARVLEIGAGTGATTRVVLSALADAAPLTYSFTDLSPTFLRQGEETLRTDVPPSVALEFARFDVEEDPAAQGFGADYEVVVVAGVLHATTDVTAALRNAAGLLRPGGLLLVHETTGHSDFLTLTFGLTQGWWRYQDPDLRLPHSPLLAPATWQAAAGAAGLDDIEVRTEGAGGGSATPCLLTARRPRPADRPDPTATVTPETARHYVRSVFAEVLRHDPENLGDHTAFDEFGVDSLVSLTLVARFEADLGPLPSTLLFEHLTIAALADHLRADRANRLAAATGTERPHAATASVDRPVARARHDAAARVSPDVASTQAGSAPAHTDDPAVRPDDIAVIGVSGRYPGAPDLDAFWRLLASGEHAVTEVPADRFAWREHYDPRPGTPNRLYTANGGFIDGVDRFDPGFFGILARDSVKIDPQERLFLETCWAPPRTDRQPR